MSFVRQEEYRARALEMCHIGNASGGVYLLRLGAVTFENCRV